MTTAIRKHLALGLAFVTITLLLIVTLTPAAKPLSRLLPARTHLFFHLIAHALLAAALLHAVPPHIPAEAVCAVSIAIAVLIELVQAALVGGRTGDIADVAAAAVGSCVVFVIPGRDGAPAPIQSSWYALTTFAMPPQDDDDDDDDGHRVGSWAV